MAMPQLKLSRLLVMMMWGILISGLIVLLVAAVRNNNSRRCRGLKISISGTDEKLFIDENEIRKAIFRKIGTGVKGRPVSEFDLHSIENSLRRDTWVKEAKLFFDNTGMFHVSVVQREPAARIFTRNGYSFYVDSTMVMLPLSDLFSARVPVFTGFPADQKVLTHRDSVLLRDICNLSLFINHDPVLSSMIDQVDITPGYEFEMIPRVGNQVISFGDASDPEEKFAKMLLFYREILTKGRINRYSRVSLKFKGQVVATIRGMEQIIPDSVSTKQMVNMIAERAERLANDTVSRIARDDERNTTDVSIIQQSLERDEPAEAVRTTPVLPATAKLPAKIPAANDSRTPATKKTVSPKAPVSAPVKKVTATGKSTDKKSKTKIPVKPAPKVTMPASVKPKNKN